VEVFLDLSDGGSPGINSDITFGPHLGGVRVNMLPELLAASLGFWALPACKPFRERRRFLGLFFRPCGQ